AICFALTFATFVVSYVLLALGREPSRELPPAPTRQRGQAAARERAAHALPKGARWRHAMRAQMRAIWALLRADGGLRRLIAGNALAGIATMAGALFAVAALKRGGLSDPEVGVESTILFIGSMAGYFLWGAIGDRHGHRAVLVWGAVCTAAS